MSRVVWIAAGWICAGLGTIGAFMPILPTVPLYLLAALCFAKGSRRLHDWFVSTKTYRENLKDYAEGKGMTRRTKARIMLTVSVQMAIGFAFMRHVPVGRTALVCVWIGLVAYFALIVKTAEED